MTSEVQPLEKTLSLPPPTSPSCIQQVSSVYIASISTTRKYTAKSLCTDYHHKRKNKMAYYYFQYSST